MATYQLSAADLLTLLASTVTQTTQTNIINALQKAGDYPTTGTISVQTLMGPPSVSGTYDDTIASGVQFVLVTTPGSTTLSGSTYSTPTIGDSLHTATFNLTTSGGVVVAVGDQAATVTDLSTSSTLSDTLLGGQGFGSISSKNGNNHVVAPDQGRTTLGGGNQTVQAGNSPTSDDTIIASSGNNSIVASQGTNRIVAGAGDDTLKGGSGDDTLIGGGKSLLVAGSGNDVLRGGSSSTAKDTLMGGSGPTILTVKQGNNSLVGGSGANTLRAGSGDDTMVGGGQSRLIGGTGSVYEVGASTGSDTLIAGTASRATLVAGTFGDDRLVAGTGDDSLYGANGHSTMVASASGIGNLNVYSGLGASRIVDTSGETASIQGGSGLDTVVLGTTGLQTITGGTGGVFIKSQQAGSALISNSSTQVGGAHTLTFTTGQTIVINDSHNNITIQFSDNTTTTT